MRGRATSVGEIEAWLIKLLNVNPPQRGAIAQLGERIVRNDEAVGSIPTSSTIDSAPCEDVRPVGSWALA